MVLCNPKLGISPVNLRVFVSIFPGIWLGMLTGAGVGRGRITCDNTAFARSVESVVRIRHNMAEEIEHAGAINYRNRHLIGCGLRVALRANI
jgi:hypothetical protein